MALLRFATAEDSSQILSIYAPYVENTVISFEYTPPSPDDFLKRIEKIKESHPYIVYEDGNKILGYAYSSTFRERIAYRYSAETSIYVHPDCHRHRIGAALYTALFNFLHEMGYYNIFACVTVPNPKSHSFHEKMGFFRAGTLKNAGYKFGEWHDIIWMEKNIAPHPANPGEVLSIHDLPPDVVATCFTCNVEL